MGYGYYNGDAIEKLLEKEDLTAEDILEEENIVQEIKGANDKFSHYVSKHPEIIKKLLQYIIVEPDQFETDFKIGFKYPFLASEIFQSEIDGIMNAFFEDKAKISVDGPLNTNQSHDNENENSKNEDENKSHENDNENQSNIDHHNNSIDDKPLEGSPEKQNLNQSGQNKEEPLISFQNLELLQEYFSYIKDQKKKLNITSVGYFAKLINALLNRKFLEILNYLYANEDVIKNLLARLEFKSISDVVGRIILLDIPYLEDYISYGKNELFPVLRIEMLEEMLEKYVNSTNYEELTNITFIVSELILRFDRINYSKELVEHILTKNFNRFGLCFKNKNQLQIPFIIKFLTTLIEFFLNKKTQQNQTEKPAENTEEIEINLKLYSSTLLNFLEQNLSSILDLLNEKLEENEMIPTLYGSRVNPLKPGVLKIIEFLNFVIKLNDFEKIESIICEIDLFTILLKLMISHEWNNILHGKIEKVIISVLESEGFNYKKQLFEKAELLDTIIKSMNLEEYVIPTKHQRKIKRGYLGFLCNISNKIICLSLEDVYIQDQINRNKQWDIYKENLLKKLNSANDRDLGGQDPRKMNMIETNLDRLPFYFEPNHKTQDNDNNENNNDDFNEREDHDNNNKEDMFYYANDNLNYHLNNYINQLSKEEEQEEDKESPELNPENKNPDLNDEEKVEFTLKDLLNDETELNGKQIKKKHSNVESEYSSNNFWKISPSKEYEKKILGELGI